MPVAFGAVLTRALTCVQLKGCKATDSSEGRTTLLDYIVHHIDTRSKEVSALSSSQSFLLRASWW